MTFTGNEHNTHRGEINHTHAMHLARLEVAANLTKHARGIMTQVEGDLLVTLGRDGKPRQTAIEVLNALYRLRDELQRELSEAHRVCSDS